MKKLCKISTARAQYLMGAAAVAGGWIMVEPPSDVTDYHYLACLPEHMMDAGDRPVDIDVVISEFRAGMERCARRKYHVRSIPEDMQAIQGWLDRLVALKADTSTYTPA